MVSEQIISKATLSVVFVLSWGSCASAMYDPYIGRFASRDPIGYADGFNLNGNYFVVAFTDPFGFSIKIPDGAEGKRMLALLNELCPAGGFSADSSGQVSASLSNCNASPDPTRGCSLRSPGITPHSGTAFPVSCGCICNAIGADCEFEIGLAKRGIAGIIRKTPPRPRTEGSCAKGETVRILVAPARKPLPGVPLFPTTPHLLDDITGIPPFMGVIPTPDFIVLAHELCGHGVSGLSHPKEAGPVIPYSPDDPVTKIENCIREEHSSACRDLGKRTGD